MTRHEAIRFAAAMLVVAVLAPASGCGRPSSRQPELGESPPVRVAPRSQVVSAGAEPVDVARAFFDAMASDRPDKANGLFAPPVGPMGFVRGISAWRGARNITAGPATVLELSTYLRNYPGEMRAGVATEYKRFRDLREVKVEFVSVHKDEDTRLGNNTISCILGRAAPGKPWYLLAVGFGE